MEKLIFSDTSRAKLSSGECGLNLHTREEHMEGVQWKNEIARNGQ